MATFSITPAGGTNVFWPELFEVDFESASTQVTKTATRFTVIWESQDWGTVEIRFNGTGLVYNDGSFPTGGRLVEGTFNGMTVIVEGQTWMTATALNLSAEALDHIWLGWVRRGEYRPGDAFDLWSFMMRGNDRINGSDSNDDLIGGRNPGNDTIFGGGGSDWIKADAGNDVIDGGDDRDTYTLTESFFDRSAFQGAVVNLATGTATDSWGGTDTLVSIERVEGSRFADQFTGSDANDRFAGLKGRDTIDGGAGWDTVNYDRDADYGGLRGVNVNLATGVARDGWGQIDTLVSIESVRGTAFNDTLIGNDQENWLHGGAGVDVINGGAGTDTADFWNDFVTAGAVVNLGRTNGQVRNDGFGNVETLRGIENLYGTFRNDNLTGNAGANWLEGDFGSDTLSGGGGADVLVGGDGADRMTGGAGADSFRFNRWDGGTPWGDTITDFQSGTDRLTFDTDDFAGMGTTLRFRNGNAAGTVGESWFYFNTATDQLFWDADGIGGDGAVLVATLTGVASLTAGDFELL